MAVIDRLDRALLVARRGGWDVIGPAWLGGAGLGLVALVIYYLEMVEGVRDVRPFLALAVVGAWWGRALGQAAASRAAVRALWPDPSLAIRPARPLAVVRLASVVGLGLWFWLWIPVLASFVDVVAVLMVLPLLAVRGAVAPSWAARAGCEPDGGVRAFRHAAVDSEDQRWAGLASEGLLLLGTVLLFFNLFLFFGMLASLGRSLLGLEVSLVQTFLSPENDFVWVAVGAATLVLLEPVRAGLGAVTYLEARMRREGLDLQAMVDRALEVGGSGQQADGRETGRAGPAGRSAAVLALVLLGSLAWSTPAIAQPGDTAVSSQAGRDEMVRSRVERILERSEFRELDQERSLGFEELIVSLLEDLGEWLEGLFDEAEESEETGLGLEPWALPLPPWQLFLGAALVLLLVVASLVLRNRLRDAREAGTGSEDEPARDPRDRAPAAHLEDAAALAAGGRYRDALRAMYLATLVALDRRGLIAFDPTRTNWHYLRALPPGEVRDGFAGFTRLFDHKWYGDEPTTEQDYVRGRELADRLCAPGGER